jgi:hypothetical protein
MPSPTTALALIRSGLALTNAVGQDQTLTSDEVQTGLDVFNDVLEQWSLDNLSLYNTANQTFSTVATQATYTIGPGGNWNSDRPVYIADPAYVTYQGVSFQVKPITQEDYNRIGLKTQPNIISQWFLYVNEDPLGLITLWPVPSQAVDITFSINRILTAVSTAGATIAFPPGYAKAFVYTLAVELAPRFGKKMRDYPDILSIQRQALGDIKRSNDGPIMLQYDAATLGPRYYDYRGYI